MYKIGRYPKNLTEAYDLLEYHATSMKSDDADRSDRKWKRKGNVESKEVV